MQNDTFEGLQYYTSESRPYGLSYGNWTVKWWRWTLSTPKYTNPVIDDSGKFASENQPIKDVWYLAGKVASEEVRYPERCCKIPCSRSILIPVINCEVSFLECNEATSEASLLHRVKTDTNTIIMKQCIVDGKPVPVQRVKSDPPIFQVQISEDNIYNVKKGGITTAAADGYWVFLKPLPTGEHQISFQGSCENGRLKSGGNYCVQIE
jgi:hypothetical protein